MLGGYGSLHESFDHIVAVQWPPCLFATSNDDQQHRSAVSKHLGKVGVQHKVDYIFSHTLSEEDPTMSQVSCHVSREAR